MTAPAGEHGARVRSVQPSDLGISFKCEDDRVIDVLFDGRRIWSFWTLRDSRSEGGARFVPWPDALGRFLDGSTRLSLVDHVAGEEQYSSEITLGEGTGRLAIEDSLGRPMGLDKSLRLSRLFESRSPEQVAPLLDSMGRVLAALEEVGIEAFLAYGTLLGAVRDGKLITHDSDADLAYVSRHTQPADAILESFRIQRMLVELGFTVTRYSGIAFRVTVLEADGTKRGLDVFGGLIYQGTLYLMGEVGAPFEKGWIYPLREVSLEGRSFPAPASPERLLEAMYGPTWRVPDPAYKFQTPKSTVRHLTGWFRGTRVGRDLDWETPETRALRRGPAKGSQLARLLHRTEDPATTVFDIGCGTGNDAVWLGAKGHPVRGLDHLPKRYAAMARRAATSELPVSFQWTNLSELRSVLATGYELSRVPGPKAVIARHVADATDRVGREHLVLLSEMLLRESGRLYLQVLAAPGPKVRSLGPVTPINVDALVSVVESRGGRIVERVDVVDPALLTDPAQRTEPRVCRLIVSWG